MNKPSIIPERSMMPVTWAKMAAITMAATTKNATPATARDESGTISGATELGVRFVIVMVRKRSSPPRDSVMHMNKFLHVQPETSGTKRSGRRPLTFVATTAALR